MQIVNCTGAKAKPHSEKATHVILAHPDPPTPQKKTHTHTHTQLASSSPHTAADPAPASNQRRRTFAFFTPERRLALDYTTWPRGVRTVQREGGTADVSSLTSPVCGSRQRVRIFLLGTASYPSFHLSCFSLHTATAVHQHTGKEGVRTTGAVEASSPVDAVSRTTRKRNGKKPFRKKQEDVVDKERNRGESRLR